jgi:hypothetical protein
MRYVVELVIAVASSQAGVEAAVGKSFVDF